MRLSWVVLALALSVALAGPAWADKRVALVIGISDYKVGGSLPQTLIDAEKIRMALADRGFEVKKLARPNLSKGELDAELLAFSDRARLADVAVLYFAGHGMQHDNDNWLIPASAELRAESHIRLEGVSLQDVVELMKRARFRIIVLDACRNNPFEVNWGQTRSAGDGLGRPAESAMPEGSLVAFSAAPRQKVPNDGLYADALARWIRADGVELKQALDRVRKDVQLKNPAAEPDYVPRYEGTFSFSAGYREASADALSRDPATVAFAAAKDGRPVAKREFRDCIDCPLMVALPAGSFMMGSPGSEAGRYDNEGPLRLVNISYQIAVAKFEVTFAEWDACVSDGICRRTPDDLGRPNGDRPVVFVSWNDARQFTVWLSRKTGQTYTLLSEAEWEYAARAGTATPWSHGNAAATLGGYAWFSADPKIGMQAVGQKLPNSYGLHDMHGGALEWVEDCWASDYSAGQSSDGRAYVVENCRNRVLRGGSWLHDSPLLRSASRFMFTPTVLSNSVGFRIVRRS